MTSVATVASGTTPARIVKTVKKSRNGCQECKAKRLKCDEVKPGCLQCKRRRKSCPGYEKKLRWSTKYEKSLSFGVDLSRDAVEALESFVVKTAPANATAPVAEPAPDVLVDDAARLPAAERQPLLQGSPREKQNEVIDDELITASDDDSSASKAAIEPELDLDLLDVPDWAGKELEDVDAFDSTTVLDTSLMLDESWTDDDVEELPVLPHKQAQPEPPPVLALSRHIVNQSTFLVEYWFDDVCQMFSAFDSDLNPNRQLARSTWSTSEPVYHALNYMSATCLADTLPHMKGTVPGLAAQAVDAIRRTTASMAFVGSDHFPTDLLFAMLAVGTSLAWTDTRQLGTWLLNDAKSILADFEERLDTLDDHARQQVIHFQQGLVYWEMLHKAVASEASQSMKRLTEPESEESSPVECPATPPAAPPHPWTGTSAQAHATFGTVMELCQRARARARQPQKMGARALREALQDIEQATRLARLLRRSDRPLAIATTNPGSTSDLTKDERTPLQHLVEAEEAYRLASLIQLYLAFPDDLDHSDNPAGSDDESIYHDRFANNHNSINPQLETVSLALQLVDTLERIPPTSGSRCILPLAIISAAAGLEFVDPEVQEPSPTPAGESHWLLNANSEDPTLSTADFDILALFSADLDSDVAPGDTSSTHVPSVATHNSIAQNPSVAPQYSIGIEQNDSTSGSRITSADLTALHVRIAHARRLVLARLNALHGSLPRRPIAIALKLVKAVWAEYDSNMVLCGMGRKAGAAGRTHWLDVMARTGLWTLFG